MGPAKTVSKIRENYYFPGMTTEIKLYCNTCEVCFNNNHAYQKNPKAPMKLFPANRPSQYLCIDLVGQLSTTARYKWILVMVDRFTKMVQAAPLTDATAPTIAKALMKTWIWKYGVPEIILSDKAGNLTTAHTMKVLYGLMNIQKVGSTAYHPQTQGSVERMNKDLVIVLKKLVADNPKTWHTKLDVACFAINSSPNATTKFTPFRLQFGRELRGPHDLLYDTTTTEYYKNGSHLAAASFYEIRDIFDLVRANISTAQQRQKQAYDKKKGFHTTYNIGDHVLIWKPISRSIKDYRKFQNHYSGPWEIQKILSKWTYQVKNLATQKVEVTHFDKLKYVPKNLRKTLPQQCNSEHKQTKKQVRPPEPTEDSDLFRTMFGTTINTRTSDPDLDRDQRDQDDPLQPEPQQMENLPRHGYNLRPRTARQA